ncbi:MAG: GNAT family N-acetyltransferase [Actinomycetia bacterium]|nr:GNAT family N-acetyltransferase [Actinomycetes bacterium]
MIPSVEGIENSGSTAWSPDETATISGWRVVSSGGFTRRLNSAASVGEVDTSMETCNAISRWLAERGAGLTVRVTPLMEDGVIAACLRDWGLARRDPTLVMVRRPEPANGHDDVVVVAADDPGYTAELIDLNYPDTSVRAAWDRIVERAGSSAVGLWVPGRAVGFTVVSNGIASVFSVAVREGNRRFGLATAIMNASAAWALERDVEWQFVQVLGTNAAAIELYEELGFIERYRYSYLQPTGE